MIHTILYKVFLLPETLLWTVISGDSFIRRIQSLLDSISLERFAKSIRIDSLPLFEKAKKKVFSKREYEHNYENHSRILLIF